MARIIVTGATGFLGGQLARHLQARGDDVIGLGRSPTALGNLAGAGIRTVALDLAEVLNGRTADMIGSADALVHCAALSSAWGARQAFVDANITGTATALKLAEWAGVRRFVNISSPSVYYSNRDQLNVNETWALPPPVNAYAETKAEAEKMVLASTGVGPVNLRPRGIYGAGDTALLPRVLGAARQGPLPLLRGGIAEIDLTHVSDVVRAIEAALAAEKGLEGQTFNISGGQPRSVVKIVNQVCAGTGVSVRWRVMPWQAVMAAAALGESVHRFRGQEKEPRLTRYKVGFFTFRQSLDTSRARHLLGWSPQIDFDDGLELTLKNGSAG